MEERFDNEDEGLGVPARKCLAVGPSAVSPLDAQANAAEDAAPVPNAPAHSPLPWSVKYGHSVVHVVDADGKPVVDTMTNVYWKDFTEKEVANATMIANACNSHGAMLTALKEVLKYRRGEGKYNFSAVPDDQRDNEAFDAWERVEQMVVEAIELVEPRPKKSRKKPRR